MNAPAITITITVTRRRRPVSVVGQSRARDAGSTITERTIHAHVRRPQPTGLDAIVMRLSLAGLHWARRHADRWAPTREQQARRIERERACDSREQASERRYRLLRS